MKGVWSGRCETSCPASRVTSRVWTGTSCCCQNLRGSAYRQLTYPTSGCFISFSPDCQGVSKIGEFVHQLSLGVVPSWSDVCRVRPINWPAVRCVIIGSNSGPQPMMDGKLCRWVFILLALVNTAPQYTCSASTQVDTSLPLGDANPTTKCGVVLYFHINKCAGGTVEQWLNHRAGAFISAYHRPTTFATSPSDGSRIWIEFERNITK